MLATYFLINVFEDKVLRILYLPSASIGRIKDNRIKNTQMEYSRGISTTEITNQISIHHYL